MSIKYKGEPKGEFRFCPPCRDSWQQFDDMDITDVVPTVQGAEGAWLR